jgi:hypothetical protein
MLIVDGCIYQFKRPFLSYCRNLPAIELKIGRKDEISMCAFKTALHLAITIPTMSSSDIVVMIAGIRPIEICKGDMLHYKMTNLNQLHSTVPCLLHDHLPTTVRSVPVLVSVQVTDWPVDMKEIQIRVSL